MRLFMIRHGQTENNVRNVFTGQDDIFLTEEGRKQAMALRPILEKITFDRVYSSDLTRAMQTQQLAMPGVSAQATPLLREIHVGSLAGAHVSEVRKLCADAPGHYRPFGGEDPEDVKARVRTFLRELEEDPCDYAAAFCHGGILRNTLNCVLNLDVNVTNLLNPNCNIVVFDYNGKNWRLLAWNYGGTL